MKKLFRFLGYVPVILVGILGAYIVFHMWQLTERFRHKESRDTRQSERMPAGNTPSIPTGDSEGAKTTTSPGQK